jgi:ATP-dependent Lhr-like helicase
MSTAEIEARSEPPDAAAEWLADLEASRRAVPIRIGGVGRWVAVEDVARLRDALGMQPPPGIPAALLEPAADPLGDVVGRYARTHAPFPAKQAATDLGLAESVVTEVLRRLERDGRVAAGAYQPGAEGTEWVDLDVLRRLRRRSLAVLRREIEAVDGERLGLFLPRWQGVGGSTPSGARLPEAIRSLQGRPIPASILESDVLPDRMTYNSTDLDLLAAAGEIVWIGHGALGTGDGRVALYFRDHVPLLDSREPGNDVPAGKLHDIIRNHLQNRGASFFNDLYVAAEGGDPAAALDALWDLVWSGEVTNDTFAPLRAFIGTKSRRSAARPNLRLSVPPAGSGRWYLVSDLSAGFPGAAPEQHAAAIAEQMLERHGILTRPAVLAEGLAGGFSGLYPVLAAMEDTGRVRRGYFVEGLGGAQFGLPGAIDRLREPADAGVVVLAAADPANVYGAALPWPDHEHGTPSRRAGAYIVLSNGALAAFIERGARSVLTWSDDDNVVVSGLVATSRRRRKSTTVTKINGESALSAPLAVAMRAAGFATGYKGLTYRPPR